jgi:hypothetical protein
MIRIAIVMAAFVAGAPAALAEEDTMTLRGKVKSVSKADKEGKVTVEITIPTGEIKEYALEIKKATKVEKANGKLRNTASAADIRTGQEVEAICGRIIAPSSPPLVPTVKSILILEAVK